MRICFLNGSNLCDTFGEWLEGRTLYVKIRTKKLEEEGADQIIFRLESKKHGLITITNQFHTGEIQWPYSPSDEYQMQRKIVLSLCWHSCLSEVIPQCIIPHPACSQSSLSSSIGGEYIFRYGYNSRRSDLYKRTGCVPYAFCVRDWTYSNVILLVTLGSSGVVCDCECLHVAVVFRNGVWRALIFSIFYLVLVRVECARGKLVVFWKALEPLGWGMGS